jgi:hypothetical protein
LLFAKAKKFIRLNRTIYPIKLKIIIFGSDEKNPECKKYKWIY